MERTTFAAILRMRYCMHECTSIRSRDCAPLPCIGCANLVDGHQPWQKEQSNVAADDVVRMLTLDAINHLDAAAFAAAFGKVYEHSAWIAERAFALRPPAGFETLAALHAALVATVGAATADEQLALLRAHPELAGVEAAAGTLTADSTREQSAAGLSAMTADDVVRLRALNTRYRERFEFPFIIAARNNTQPAIFGTLDARLHNTREMEVRNSLAQVGEIARLRLAAMTSV